MKVYAAQLLIASVAVCFALPAQSAPISKQLQQACNADYKRHCDEYGLETSALRVCMDRAGHQLSKGCVRALINAGEVTEAEVQRRKKSGR